MQILPRALCSCAMLLAPALGGLTQSVAQTAPVAPAVSPAPAAPLAVNGPLTLEESIRIALRANGQPDAAQLQAQSARENVTAARAAGYPQITGNVGYNYLNQRTIIVTPTVNTGVGTGVGGTVGGGTVGGGTVGGTVGAGGVVTGVGNAVGFTSSAVTTGIVVTQNIFDGGRIRQLVRGARASSQNALGGFGSARTALAFTVAQRFYEQLRQQKLTEQYRAQVALAEQQVAQVRAQIEAGTVARVDILTVQVSLRQAQFDLVTARNNLATARVNFRNVLGLGSGPALELLESPRVTEIAGIVGITAPRVTAPNATAPETATAPAATVLEPDELVPGIAVPPLSALPTPDILNIAPPNVPELAPLATYLAQASALRPDLLQAQAAVAQGESALVLASIASRPQVAASVGANLDPRATNERRLQLGVGLSVPIFNGGGLSASRRAARDQLSASRLALAQLQKDASADVESSYINVSGQVERIANARVLVEQAQLNLQTATERYRLGLGIVLDVTNAQTQLFSAQVSATQAVYDYEIARATLDRAVGRFAWADPGTPPPVAAPDVVPVELRRGR